MGRPETTREETKEGDLGFVEAFYHVGLSQFLHLACVCDGWSIDFFNLFLCVAVAGRVGGDEADESVTHSLTQLRLTH